MEKFKKKPNFQDSILWSMDFDLKKDEKIHSKFSLKALMFHVII
jgi:hypothetical protein